MAPNKEQFDSLLIKSVKLYPSLYDGSKGSRDVIWNTIYTDMKDCVKGFGKSWDFLL